MQALLRQSDLNWAWFGHLLNHCEQNIFRRIGVQYFCVPEARHLPGIGKKSRNLLKTLGLDKARMKAEVDAYVKIVDEFNPEVIHIHGSESFYGLIAAQVPTPSVLGIQGILSEVY